MRNLYEIFNKLDIFYEEFSHLPVFTVADIQKLSYKIEGTGCKNLFLVSHENYYLYVLEENKKANLKDLSKNLGISRLSFASIDDLKDILG